MGAAAGHSETAIPLAGAMPEGVGHAVPFSRGRQQTTVEAVVSDLDGRFFLE